jgi:hypothetical protein
LIEDDGDIARGLGFVALYAAYLEEQVENLLNMLVSIEPYDDAKQRWPVSKKIKHAIKVLTSLDSKELPELTNDLLSCLELFNDRNEIIHGRIYATFDRPLTLKSGRPNIPDREVKSSELYNLANEFEYLTMEIYRPMAIRLPKAITTYLTARTYAQTD